MLISKFKALTSYYLEHRALRYLVKDTQNKRNKYHLGVDWWKLSARNFESQVNEFQARVAVLNKFTELGRPHI